MFASRYVVLRSGAKWLLLAGVFSYSTGSLALGLGEITVHSALNQRFKADIALVDVGGLTQSDLTVSLATADEFDRAGVERVFFLNDLKFMPILRGNRHMIRVTSSKPVNEPFLNFLVQLNQPNGRLLREYTVLIDPSGSPGIVPATDEPDSPVQSSEFPMVEPAAAPPQAAQGKRETAPSPVTVPANDVLSERLAASVLLSQQLQKTVDEQNAKLLAQDVQIADGQKQVSDLKTRLAERQKPPSTVTPAPVEPTEDSPGWPLLGGLLLLLGALGALFVRRRQQRLEDAPPPVAPLDDTEVDEAEASHHASVNAARDEQESIRARYPKRTSAAALIPVLPIAAATSIAPEDEFELKLGELSMDASWSLEGSRATPAQPPDDDFLNEFSDPGLSLELEPLEMQLSESTQR